MMEKGIATYSAIGTALVTTGIAAWALLKWHQVSQQLKRLSEKYTKPKNVQGLLLQHFGNLSDIPLLKSLIPQKTEEYHQALANFAMAVCDEFEVPRKRVLDVGCGPGGTSFFLSVGFEKVIGTDTSMPMIMAGQQLKQYSEFGSPFSLEGGKFISLVKIRVPEGANRDRVTFWDEDVCALSYVCGFFDCVLVSNTLSDLQDPKAFLLEIDQYVKVGGLLIISDVYNWEEGPEEKLGGEGDVPTFSILKTLLSPSWSFQKEANIPYYFAKSARLAELGNAHVTVWKKKDPLDS